jgi:hypothetical protein
MVLRLTCVSASVALLGLVSLMPVAAAGAVTARRDSAPALQFVSKTGYRVAVEGTGWRPNHRVTFSLAQGSPVFGLELRSTSRGAFIVGVKNIDLCNGDSFAAGDLAGHRAQLAGPGLGCAVNPHPPTPQLTVVKGKLLSIAVTHIDTPPYEHSVVIRQADALYLWESGTTNPAFVPSAPATFFFLIGHGQTPPSACPEVECGAGFYWEWVGMKRGRTGIAMNPSCRPQCEIPSYLIPVRITRR